MPLDTHHDAPSAPDPAQQQRDSVREFLAQEATAIAQDGTGALLAAACVGIAVLPRVEREQWLRDHLTPEVAAGLAEGGAHAAVAEVIRTAALDHPDREVADRVVATLLTPRRVFDLVRADAPLDPELLGTLAMAATCLSPDGPERARVMAGLMAYAACQGDLMLNNPEAVADVQAALPDMPVDLRWRVSERLADMGVRTEVPEPPQATPWRSASASGAAALADQPHWRDIHAGEGALRGRSPSPSPSASVERSRNPSPGVGALG